MRRVPIPSAVQGHPALAREEVLHLYLAALLEQLGGNVTLSVEQLAKVRDARMKHQLQDGAVVLTLEVA